MSSAPGKTVRIVVAGAGLIGQAHIRRVLDTPGAELAGIVDNQPKFAEQAAGLGVPFGSDLDAMLDQVRPDGVVVALPNRFHFAVGMALVKRGLPMLMEKPVCNSLDEANAFAAATEAAGVAVLVGHHHRHSPLIQRAKEIIESGRLGRVTAIHGFCWFLKPKSYFEGAGAWRARPGGGVVLINLVHVIDDLRNLCGDIVSVQAAQSNAARGFPVEETVGIVLTFANGAIGTLTISDAAAAPWSWELTSGENRAYPRTDEFCYVVGGMEGSLTIPRMELWHHGEERSWWAPIRTERAIAPDQDPVTLELMGDPLTNEMRHFCQVVRGEAAPLLDARGGARTLATTLAVKQAAESGERILLS